MINPIITKLFEIGSLRVGNFTLKSGQQSPIYVDLRAIISFPPLLRAISEAIWQNHTHTVDFVCGVPYTALPIATSITLNHNIPMVMRRKEIKDYGTKKMVEGVFEAGQTCIIIEDVVTTGMSILETAKDLEAAGLKVVEILAFLDREQGGAENLRNAGYSFRAATSLTQIAEHLFHIGLIDDTLKQEIFQCRQTEGAQ